MPPVHYTAPGECRCKFTCCCCGGVCGKCGPEYLYSSIDTVTGPGSGPWASFAGTVGVWRRALANTTANVEDFPSAGPGGHIPCSSYCFIGVLPEGETEVLEFDEECAAAIFGSGGCASHMILKNVYKFDAIGPDLGCVDGVFLNACPPTETLVLGYGANGLFGPCSTECVYVFQAWDPLHPQFFGAEEPECFQEIPDVGNCQTFDTYDLRFTFQFCTCSEYEDEYGDRCDTTGADPFFASMTIIRYRIVGAEPKVAIRTATSCQLTRQPETGCPIIPSAQRHTLVWGERVCDGDGFVSQTFTATFKIGSTLNDPCADEVVITGTLYA